MRHSSSIDTKLLIPSQPHLPKSVQPKVMLANKKTPQVFPRMGHNIRVASQPPQPAQNNKAVPATPPKGEGSTPFSPAQSKQNDVQLQRRRFLQMMRSGNPGAGEGAFEIRMPEQPNHQAAMTGNTPIKQDQPATEKVPERILSEIQLEETIFKIDSNWEEQYRMLITKLGGNVCDNDEDNVEDGLTPEEVDAFVRKHGNTPKASTPLPDCVHFYSPFTSPTKSSPTKLDEGSDLDDDSDDDDDL